VSTILQDERNGFGQAALAFLNRFALAIGSGNLRATRNLPFPVVFNNCRKFITDDVPPQVYNGLSKVTTILTQGAIHPCSKCIVGNVRVARHPCSRSMGMAGDAAPGEKATEKRCPLPGLLAIKRTTSLRKGVFLQEIPIGGDDANVFSFRCDFLFVLVGSESFPEAFLPGKVYGLQTIGLSVSIVPKSKGQLPESGPR